MPMFAYGSNDDWIAVPSRLDALSILSRIEAIEGPCASFVCFGATWPVDCCTRSRQQVAQSCRLRRCSGTVCCRWYSGPIQRHGPTPATRPRRLFVGMQESPFVAHGDRADYVMNRGVTRHAGEVLGYPSWRRNLAQFGAFQQSLLQL